MKWFMHQSKANRDIKLKKVLMKYGGEGYGLYWYCLENICADIEPKLTFELEIDAEILAHELKIDTLKVEEMMRFMVSLGLFEESSGVITCLKMASHLGDNFTRNKGLKEIIRKSKESNSVSDIRRLVSDGHRQSTDGLETVTERGEEKRREEKKNRGRFTPPTLEEISDYCKSRGNSVDPQKFLSHYEANGWMRGKNKIKDWRACVRYWETTSEPRQGEESYF